MDKLIVKPKKLTFFEYFAYILAVVFCGSVIAFLLIMAHNLLSPENLTQPIRNLYFLIGIAVASLVLPFWFVSHREKYTWKLVEDMLIRGTKNRLEIPFSSIAKLVVGLPQRNHWSDNISRKITPGPAHLLDISFRTTVVIKLNNGKLIPLNIHSCELGTELTNQLLEQMKDKIDEQYRYSDVEVQALRKPRWNDLMEIN